MLESLNISCLIHSLFTARHTEVKPHVWGKKDMDRIYSLEVFSQLGTVDILAGQLFMVGAALA